MTKKKTTEYERMSNTAKSGFISLNCDTCAENGSSSRCSMCVDFLFILKYVRAAPVQGSPVTLPNPEPESRASAHMTVTNTCGQFCFLLFHYSNPGPTVLYLPQEVSLRTGLVVHMDFVQVRAPDEFDIKVSYTCEPTVHFIGDKFGRKVRR